MVGLSVLLESKKNGMFLNRRRWVTTSCPPQIANHAAMHKPSCSSSSASFGFDVGAETRAFLDQCFLCKRRLLQNEDIYMYMGEMAFCSDDCRFEHIKMEAVGLGGQEAEEENGERSSQKGSTSPGKFKIDSVFSATCSPRR